MDYEITQLSPNLVLIRWHCNPTSQQSERQFVEHLENILDNVPHPIYFFSDLRDGHISNVYTLRKMGELTRHANWAGGIALGQRLSTDMFVNTFERMSAERKGDRMLYSVAAALESLESMKAGITETIDWSRVFNSESTNS